MEPEAKQIARAAAARIAATDNNARLETDVSRQLDNPDGTTPQDYEPVSLAIASVVISAATLAWTIYRDLRNDRRAINPDAIARRVRVQIADQHPDISARDRDRIIDIIVEETDKHHP
jgi:hypothetical protein